MQDWTMLKQDSSSGDYFPVSVLGAYSPVSILGACLGVQVVWVLHGATHNQSNCLAFSGNLCLSSGDQK